MTSINNTLGQDLFIAALKQVDPLQKKQMCKQLKEMFPDHPLVAQVAKVLHLLKRSTVEWVIANSSIKYLEGLSTPETAMTELLWNSYMGGKEIDQGNLLLFRILDSSDQYKLKSKLANHLIEKNDTLGLSATSLAFMQARGLQGPNGYSNPEQALTLYDKVISDTDSASDLIARAKYQKALLLNRGEQGVQIDPAAVLDLYNQVINDKYAPRYLIPLAKYQKALIFLNGGEEVQMDLVTALDLYNQVINDKHAPPDFIARVKYYKARLLHGGHGVQMDRATALDLYNQVINDENTPLELIPQAKYQKALILHNGGQGVQIDLAIALDLYAQVIIDEHAPLSLIPKAKFHKAVLLLKGGEGVQMDQVAALDLYTQVINDNHTPPDFIAQAKFWKAFIFHRRGEGVQKDQVAALDLYTQVINDNHTPPDFIAQAKFWKAFIFHRGGEGVQMDQAAALDLYNQLVNGKHTPPNVIAMAKFYKVEILIDNNALPPVLLKAAYATRNTPKWQEVLTLLREKFGGENFPSLNSPEERFYSMLLLDEPEAIFNYLKESGLPPTRFGADMQNFLTYLLTSDLPDFSDFQTQVLEAIRENYPSLLKKIDLNLLARETLSKICYEAAQKYAGGTNHELTDWFYEQIPFGSSKYAEGLEGSFMLHSNLAIAENPSFIHRYCAIKFFKMKIAKYSHHLRTKQNAPQNQKETINALIRQIDEIKEKAKEELKTRAPTPSLMTGPILQLMEVRDALIPTTSKRTANELDQPKPKCAKTEDDSLR